jgi:hypothetical protein
MKESFKTLVSGHVVIKDNKTGEILVDKHNAIHPKNMATAIARGLSNSVNHQIYKLKLGNGGTFIDGTMQIAFNPPLIGDTDNDLYSPTYVEIVDDQDLGVDSGNSVQYTNIPASPNSRVIITCIIDSTQAINQPTDGGPGPTDPDAAPGFFFDELGLFTKEVSGNLLNGVGDLMLSHLIFSPIEHTGNRELTIVYTLTISVS